MARELKYTITGDEKDLVRALKSVDRRLGQSEQRAHGFSKGLASAMGGVGKAAGAAGTAIAVGLVVEAKRATEAFQESNKVARQTQAVLKSTGGAANVTAREVSNLATAISRKTGVDDEAVQSAENLLLTFTQVRNEAGKGNRVFDQTTKAAVDMAAALGTDTRNAAMQLGKALNDPEKGVTRLTRSGVTFTDQQKEQIKTLQESGRRLDAQKIILREVTKEFGGSAAAQATSTEKLKVAFGNLEEDLGSGLAPAVDSVANKLTAFAIEVEPKVIKAADRIAKTFGRKDLSLDQKFRLSAAQAEDVFHPLIVEARRSVSKMHLGDQIGEGVDKAIPLILDTVAAHAPQAAEAFVHGFAEAGVWGKVLGAGFLINKFGGLGAFRGAGATAATTAATGAAAGATGAAASGARGILRKVPVVGAVAAATTFAIHDAKKNVDDISKLTLKVREYGKELERMGANKGLDELQRKFESLGHSDDAGDWSKKQRRSLLAFAEATVATAKDVRRSTNSMAASYELLVDPTRRTSDELLKTTRDVSNHFGYMERTSKSHLKDIKTAVKDNMGVIKTRLGEDSRDGKNAMAANFRMAAHAVQKSMDDGKISTRTGTRQIRSYLVKALESLGLTGEQAQNKIDTGTTGQVGNLGKGIPRMPAARGMYIGSPGERGGDTVPLQAMVGRGEYAAVFNGQQQGVLNSVLGATLGTSLDGFFNRYDRPHYTGPGLATGGSIPRVRVAAAGTAGGMAQRAVSIDRSAAIDVLAQAAATLGAGESSTTGLVAQVRRALSWAHGHGWHGQVTSGFRSRAKQQYLWDHRASNPNPVAPPGTSNHERGRAVDVSDIAGFQHAMATAPANARLRWYGPKDPVHFSVDGHARGGRLARMAGGGTYSHAQLAALWKRAGGDPSRADLMAAIAQAESSGIPSAHNPSGASGLWQILGEPFAGDVYDPLTNARMAVAKYRSQGLGAWEAYTKGTYRGFLSGSSGRSGGSAASARRAAARSQARGRAQRGAALKASRKRALNAPMGGRKIGAGHPDASAHGVAGARPGDRQLLPTTMSDPTAANWGGMPSFADQASSAATPQDYLDAALALAGLTDTTDDDLAALRNQQGYDQEMLAVAQQKGDPRAIAEWANNLKSVNDSIQTLIQSNDALADAQKAAQADLAAELKRHNEIQTAIANSDAGVLKRALADTLSGQIGTGLTRAFATPMAPGMSTRY